MHEIPLPGPISGRLYATGFTVVGADPAGALGEVDATTMICLITDDEIAMRFPAYARWLLAAGPIDVVRFPIPDWGTVDDELLLDCVDDTAARLTRGERIVTHCGAGMGRTGVLCTLVLVRLGMPLASAIPHVRASRPGAGPDSDDQREQIERLAAILG